MFRNTTMVRCEEREPQHCTINYVSHGPRRERAVIDRLDLDSTPEKVVPENSIGRKYTKYLMRPGVTCQLLQERHGKSAKERIALLRCRMQIAATPSRVTASSARASK